MMGVTLREVAKKAGVSPMAVSRVLHGRGDTVRVSDQTAVQIRRVADELGYTANTLARSLRDKRTRNIGLLFQKFGRISEGPQYLALMMDGLAQTTFARGYSLTICAHEEEHPGRFLADGRFDGVVWAKLQTRPQNTRALATATVPVVLLHEPVPADGLTPVSTICCDNEQGMKLAVSHLVGLGHRHIAFADDMGYRGEDEATARLEGFRKAMAMEGLPPSDADILHWTSYAEEMSAWWHSRPAHTAIVCRSEALAVAVYRRAAELGIRIPGDLSVIGFDSTAFCDHVSPRMTAIWQPIEEMGVTAANCLIDQIEGKGGPQALKFPCRLDLRESTSAPTTQGRRTG